MPFTCSEGRRLTVGSLFSGIGGIDLGMERAGCEVVWQVEIDPFCRRVLEKHWPGVPKHDDIRTFNTNEFVRPDIIVGGFPCQPFSLAGKRGGTKDDRHLWPEMCRLISELRPTWVIGENVAGIIGMALDGVLSDLEGLGYACRTFVIPACAVGAKHRRDRVWIVAHPDGTEWRKNHSSRISNMRRDDSYGVQEWEKVSSGFSWGSKDGDLANTDKEWQSQPERAISKFGGWIGNSSKAVCNAAIQGLPQWAGGEMGQPQPLTEFERSGGDGKEREVERDFRGMAHGVSRRVDRLRSLGNAVVPQIPEMIGRTILASIGERAAA